MSSINYKSAGVNIEAGNEVVKRIKAAAEKTFTPHVLSSIGGFGALYDLQSIAKQYEHPVLVQSIDGVGTKMMVANMMQQFDTIGIDLVSATVNDIVVLGARPLTLLDYIANATLAPQVIESIVKGISRACQKINVALIGGETAEMPGTYLPGEYDLVGVVTGIVEKANIITGANIVPGDHVLAFASSGLHTNGYSLARKLLFEVARYDLHTFLPELSATIGETLLLPHLNYAEPVLAALEKAVVIKGMAHITGGGLLENIPRILPSACDVEINKNAAPVLPIFNLLQRLGELDETEMYRTFNMGMGLILITDAANQVALQQACQQFKEFSLYQVGRVIAGSGQVRLV